MNKLALIINLFKEGLSINKISKIVDVYRGKLTEIGFDENFIKPNELELQEKDKIISYYNELNNIKEIKKIYNDTKVRHAYILHVLRDTLDKKKIHKDNSFFQIIDTEEKAYWLGMIAADGYLKKKYIVGLSSKDKEHLEKLLKSLKCNAKIVNKFSKKFPNSINYEVDISSEQLHNDLVKLGIVHRKSLVLREFISQIPIKLVRHTIRGYLDGDGSLGIRKDGGVWLNFLGTEEVCESIVKYFENGYGAIKHDNFKYSLKKYDNIYRLSIGSKKYQLAIIKHLYEDATIYLDRKFERAKKIINYLNQKINN
jgi:hypothetical protein